MPVEAVAYVRSYKLVLRTVDPTEDGRVEFPRPFGPIEHGPVELPPAVTLGINSRYRGKPDSVRYHELDPIEITVGKCRSEVHRTALSYPPLSVVDVTLLVTGDIPAELLGVDGGQRPGGQPKDILLGPDGRTVNDHWNDAVEELVGISPGDWPYALGFPRTQFGLVCWDRCSHVRRYNTRGIADQDRLEFEGRFRLYVKSTDAFAAGRGRFIPYTILAGLCSRTRLLTEDVRDQVGTLVEDNRSHSTSPVRLMHDALQLQGEAIHVREKTSGQAFLGGDRLPLIYGEIRDIVTMGEVDRQDLEQSLNGLHLLAEGSFQQYIERGGQRASAFAVLFGFLSLIFGGVAVSELVQARTNGDLEAIEAVVVAWILVVICLLCLYAWSRKLHRRR